MEPFTNEKTSVLWIKQQKVTILKEKVNRWQRGKNGDIKKRQLLLMI